LAAHLGIVYGIKSQFLLKTSNHAATISLWAIDWVQLLTQAEPVFEKQCDKK